MGQIVEVRSDCLGNRSPAYSKNGQLTGMGIYPNLDKCPSAKMGNYPNFGKNAAMQCLPLPSIGAQINGQLSWCAFLIGHEFARAKRAANS